MTAKVPITNHLSTAVQAIQMVNTVEDAVLVMKLPGDQDLGEGGQVIEKVRVRPGGASGRAAPQPHPPPMEYRRIVIEHPAIGKSTQCTAHFYQPGLGFIYYLSNPPWLLFYRRAHSVHH